MAGRGGRSWCRPSGGMAIDSREKAAAGVEDVFVLSGAPVFGHHDALCCHEIEQVVACGQFAPGDGARLNGSRNFESRISPPIKVRKPS